MGWFDEQIKARMKNDQDSFNDSFVSMSNVVMGASALRGMSGEVQMTRDAIEEILKYYHIKPEELPVNVTDVNEQLEFLLRPSGIMRRLVTLQKGWYKDAIGPLLGQTVDGNTVAIIPTGFSGYEFYDCKAGKKVKANKKTAQRLKDEAYCFYLPLPLKELKIRDLAGYIFGCLSASDLIMIAVSALAVTLIGLLTPKINSFIFADVITGGQTGILIPIAALMLGASVSAALIGITKNLLMARIKTKMDVQVQAASMMRILSLPANFFKKFSAGELAARAELINKLCSMLCDAVLTSGLSAALSLIYIWQMAFYAPSLVLPAITIVLLTLVVIVVTTLSKMNVTRKQYDANAKQSGILFALISGVQKLKLSGAERRAFAKWAGVYKEQAEWQYNPPMFVKISTVITTAVSLLGTVLIYYSAAASRVTVADYVAFNAAYGMVAGAFTSLAFVALTAGTVKPMMEMVEPILKTVPEISTDKKVVNRITGSIEINNVSFRYNENMPLILDNLSLKIRAGQYVAIVGTTGCGKSTLMRLLLGFEAPQKGAIYYDGKDMKNFDLKSMRQKIGVVLQNGKLFQGDIYSNIVISAPWLTLDQAWNAAEMAGMAEDIRNMPMGMHTIISEGSGGISGGQRQRIIIARAIAPKPRILMFDEATSALDNITQKTVSDSLDHLKCTRIVIAHRLSTIRHCDRIIVLDKGHIIEDGTYDELLTKNGFFAKLVARQRVDA